jgi:integrase
LERLRVYFRWRRPADWLFPSKQRPGEPLANGTIRALCRNAGRRASIGRLVFPHLFRHYAASRTMPRNQTKDARRLAQHEVGRAHSRQDAA